MTKQIYIIFILFLPIICFSQQARIGYINDISGIGYSFTYHSKFLISNKGPVFFDNNTEFYQSKKVKQVEIINDYDQVLWVLKLDPSGQISTIGKRNNGYFVENTENKFSDKEYTKITRYYNYSRTQLLRIDSTTYLTREYNNGDSIIGYSFIYNRSYKSGSLINDQNRYYNSKYLNKEIDPNVFSYKVLVSDALIIENNVYFKDPFKTDYDSLELYLSLSERRIENTFGYLKSNGNSFEIENSEHPFLKNQEMLDFRHCHTDGESFNEPTFTNYQSVSIDNTNYEYNNGYKKGYDYNDSGLITEHYTNYYPEDKEATIQAKKLAAVEKQTNNFATEAAGRVYYQNVIRQKEPIRKETYYYRYEYYK